MMCSRPLLGGMVHSYVLISRPCRSRLKDGSQSVGLAGTSFTCVQRSRDCLVSELLVAPAWAMIPIYCLNSITVLWSLCCIYAVYATPGPRQAKQYIWGLGLGLELRAGKLYNGSQPTGFQLRETNRKQELLVSNSFC